MNKLKNAINKGHLVLPTMAASVALAIFINIDVGQLAALMALLQTHVMGKLK